MNVFGLRQIQLKVLMVVFFDDVEPTRVLGNVGIKQVMIDVQQIVYKLSVVSIVIVGNQLALLKAIVAISSVSCKIVNSYFVNTL